MAETQTDPARRWSWRPSRRCAGAAQVGRSFPGKGVHEAARIADLAEGGEIVASRATVGDASSYRISESRSVTLKGLSEPMDVVSIDWH